MSWKTVLTLVATLGALGTANGASIVVGNHNLQPNMSGQVIQIFVSGGDAIQGVVLNAQLGDGGPEFGGFDIPGITVPVLSGGDVTAPYTIFGSNNTGLTDLSYPPANIVNTTTTTISGFIPANGILVELLIDTTGIPNGFWPLLLSGTVNGDTDFGGMSINITNGSVGYAEPSSLVLAALGLVGLAAWGWRRKR